MGSEPVINVAEIAAWQAGWNTPAEVLGAVVRRATGADMVSHDRILEGHENEVYRVVTSDDTGVIVRIGRRSGRPFEREVWPMQAARRLGLPVPEVLLIEHTVTDGKDVSFNVQSRLPGRPMHQLKGRATDDELMGLTMEAGRLLATLHTIEPAGRGPIDPTGAIDVSLGMDNFISVDAMAERISFLVDHGCDPALVEAATALVERNMPLLDAAPVRLTHGDWSVANLLIDRGSISGIVDWGGGGGDPASECRGWDLWNEGPTSSEVLFAGYAAGGGTIDTSFRRRRLIHHVATMQDAMSHFLVTNQPDLLARATAQLRSALESAGTVL